MATAEPGPPPPKPACAVTFGRCTLLGRYLAAALAASGRWSAVAILDPSSPTSPSPAPGPSASHLVYHHDVDLSDHERLVSALAGAAAVFHVDATTAAASGSDGSFLSLHRFAVEGTRRLLAACRSAGVERLVYTGSADVVASVARDVINADEDSAPYPDKVWLLAALCFPS
jgi:sterol-4alpha-carboxylate 3-dehydrogenase (decarboxylating)